MPSQSQGSMLEGTTKTVAIPIASPNMDNVRISFPFMFYCPLPGRVSRERASKRVAWEQPILSIADQANRPRPRTIGLIGNRQYRLLPGDPLASSFSRDSPREGAIEHERKAYPHVVHVWTGNGNRDGLRRSFQHRALALARHLRVLRGRARQEAGAQALLAWIVDRPGQQRVDHFRALPALRQLRRQPRPGGA